MRFIFRLLPCVGAGIWEPSDDGARLLAESCWYSSRTSCFPFLCIDPHCAEANHTSAGWRDTRCQERLRSQNLNLPRFVFWSQTGSVAEVVNKQRKQCRDVVICRAAAHPVWLMNIYELTMMCARRCVLWQTGAELAAARIHRNLRSDMCQNFLTDMLHYVTLINGVLVWIVWILSIIWPEHIGFFGSTHFIVESIQCFSAFWRKFWRLRPWRHL